MKREEGEEEEDDLLDDGWVQRDEQKEQIKRRLKRTGYGRWRKSLDAATRHQLEREKVHPTTMLAMDIDYEHYTQTVQQPDQTPAPRSAPNIATSSASRSSSWRSPVMPAATTTTSPTASRPELSSSKSLTGPDKGSRSSRLQQRRSIGVARAELQRALAEEQLPSSKPPEAGPPSRTSRSKKEKTKKRGSVLSLFWRKSDAATEDLDHNIPPAEGRGPC